MDSTSTIQHTRVCIPNALQANKHCMYKHSKNTHIIRVPKSSKSNNYARNVLFFIERVRRLKSIISND